MDGCVMALGTFDGLHPGHKAVLLTAVALSRTLNTQSLVYTFCENPRSLFGPAPRQLLSAEEKIRRMRALGIDRVECVHFTRELAALTPQEFIDRIEKEFRPAAFVVGEDYSFGCGGSGSVDTLRRLASEKGIRVCAVPLVTVKTKDGPSKEKVSSTRIRRALDAGENDLAQKLINGEEI